MIAPNHLDLYVVDVCGTLVREDTTLGLLKHHFRHSPRHRARFFLLLALTAKLSPLRLAFIAIEKFTGQHVLKHVLVGLLSGDLAADLEASANDYAICLLDKQRVAAVWSRLAEATSSDQIILASASLEPIVKALADATGSRFVASRLQVRDGVLTGRYEEDLTGIKELAINKKYGPELLKRPFAAFSDNLTDRALLEKASRSCVVLHRETHRDRWSGMNAEFVKVDA